MPPSSGHKDGRANPFARVFPRIIGLTKVLVGILSCATLLKPALAFNAPSPDPLTYSLSLTWDPSPSPEVVGYRLYYGAESGNYTNSIAISNVTAVAVSGLLSGVTYYFALTAVAVDGQESDFSNEVTYRRDLAGAQMQIHSVSDGQFMLTVTGPPGNTYDIEATQDFVTWTVIGTGTLDATGLLNFTDTNAANFPQRFYRTRDTQPSTPGAQVQATSVSAGQFTLTVAGSAGHTYEIEATQDFTTWSIIGTVTAGASGLLNFTDTNAAYFPQRFYRTRDTQL